MPSLLLNLTVQPRLLKRTKSSDGGMTQDVAQPAAIQAVLSVFPGNKEDLNALGELRVTVEAMQMPKFAAVPDMTPDQLHLWLVEILKRAL